MDYRVTATDRCVTETDRRELLEALIERDRDREIGFGRQNSLLRNNQSVAA